ncbi:MAG: phage major capsid protein [Bellilinea sp.]
MKSFENALKSLGKTETEMRVGNYIVLFNSRDLEFLRKGKNMDGSLGEYFAPTVKVDSEYTRQGRLAIDFEHGADPEVKNGVLGYVDWETARRDDKGIFVERVLDRRNRYIQLLEDLIDEGLIGNSSEAIPEHVKTLDDGAIVNWPLMRDTLTVMPVEPQMLTGNVLQAMKALSSEFSAAKRLLEKNLSNHPGDQSGGGIGGTRGDRATSRTSTGSNNRKVKTMDILEAIKKLVPGLTPEQIEQIAAIMGLSGMAVSPNGEPVADEAGEELKSIPLSKLTAELKALGYDVVLPGQKPAAKKAAVRPPYDFKPEKKADPDDDDDDDAARAAKSVSAAHMLRFKDETPAQKAILSDVIGKDYQQLIYEQNVAFGRYARGGERALSPDETKALHQLYFPTDAIMGLILNGGFSASRVKATQVEAIGELGGFAVPPNVQAEADRRLPGLVAVRGGGARVVQLNNSNSIEIPQYVGNSDRWMGLLRGAWGTETQIPTEKNFKLKMVPVFAEVYTYKVRMSRSLVEDAANLVSLLQEDIVTTAAIDEDDVFITGDGVGKPFGILPGGANANGLKEVNSGAAAALTATGVKKLKRGLAPQYRSNGRWIANGDTYGLIETLQNVANGTYVFEDLSETDKLLNRPVGESGGMPDVAAGTFPTIFGDMSGYTIVERLGMTIERFMDSGTGPNVIEFHVRRRLGGRLEQPWKFAVQKVSA